MASEHPNRETDITPQGAVEVDESDLDQASGGAAYLKMPTDQLKYSPTSEFADIAKKVAGDGSVKPGEFTMKKI